MTSGERTQIRRALRAVQAAGFYPVAVDDGGHRLVYGGKPILTETEVLGAVSAVDDARVHFRTQDNAKPRRAWFYVVLGNARDGSEVIADWTVTPGFTEAIDSIMMD